jgi:hypothetical protein
MAKEKAAQRPIPNASKTETKTMTETPVLNESLELSSMNKEMPKDYNTENAIQLGDDIREIKSTKLKYHRNGVTGVARILQRFPVSEIVNVEAGVFDEKRNGDQLVFDFLVAVFDDAEFVKQHYDDMTSADIDRILEIFFRLNGITEREEKNRQAKEMKT